MAFLHVPLFVDPQPVGFFFPFYVPRIWHSITLPRIFHGAFLSCFHDLQKGHPPPFKLISSELFVEPPRTFFISEWVYYLVLFVDNFEFSTPFLSSQMLPPPPRRRNQGFLACFSSSAPHYGDLWHFVPFFYFSFFSIRPSCFFDCGRLPISQSLFPVFR